MTTRKDIKIAVVHTLFRPFIPSDAMNWIRWYRISEALANRGYQVDLICNGYFPRKDFFPNEKNQNFRIRNVFFVRWKNYDVIKTLFHKGIRDLKRFHGTSHPFIITKLGASVFSRDQEGIYFYGKVRERLLEEQNWAFKYSRYITTLTDANERCLRRLYPDFCNYLRVPTGVDTLIPPPRRNPYLHEKLKICIYAGNLYTKKDQPEINLRWQLKLNKIGELLLKKGVRLYFIGTGDTRRLNPKCVFNIGPIPSRDVWDYQYFADVGLALSHGPICDNESSKIYYYLRGGLPTVAEDSLPNSHLVYDVKLGAVAPYDNVYILCEAAAHWAHCDHLDKKNAMQWMVEHHSWDKRAEVYDTIFKRDFNLKDDAGYFDQSRS